MPTIWKFNLDITDMQYIQMPEKAEVLSVGDQNGRLCLWAMVNPTAPLEERFFEVFGTGHSLPVGVGVARKFIGTVQMGLFVWHIFDRS